MGRGDLLLFGDTLQAVAMLYVLLFIGILLATKPWFQSGPNLLSRLLTQIILPFNVFQSVTRYLASLSEAGTLLPLFFWALLTLLVSIAVSWGLSYVMHLPRLRKGVFIGAASFPNIILLGFPIVEAIYGAEVMKYTVIYFIADTVLFWSLGTYILIYFGEAKEKKFSVTKSLKQMVSPSLLGLLLAMIFTFLEIPLPVLAQDIISRISQCSTFLSMIFIGAIIRQTKFSRSFLSKDLISALVLKLVVIPALLILLLSMLPIPMGARYAFFPLTAMPVCVNFSILTHQYRCDYQFAAVVSAAMNVLCIAAIPLYSFLLFGIWG